MHKTIGLLVVVSLFSVSTFSQTFSWAYRMGNTGADEGASVVLDDAGNSYVTGSFSGTVDFNPAGTANNFVSGGGTDIFVTKYDASGLLSWRWTAGSGLDDGATDIALDAAGNVYVTGYIRGSANFFSSVAPFVINRTSNGGQDIFLAKYSNAGVLQWVFNIGGVNDDVGLSLDSDASGDVFLTGGFQGATIDFNPSGVASNLSSNGGSEDIFYARYSTGGVLLNAQAIGGTGADRGQAISRDNGTNVYLGGTFEVTTNFGGTSLTSNGGKDGFLASYNVGGGLIFATQMGGAADDQVRGVDYSLSDNVYVTGDFAGATVNFGGINLSSAGALDIFVAKFTTAGAGVWANRMGGANDDSGADIEADDCGNIAVAGRFTGTVDFDPSAATLNLTAPATPDFGYFLGNYDTNGALEWAGTGAAATGDSEVLGIDVDQAGNFAATGYFDTSMDGDITSGTATLVPSSLRDIFMSRHFEPAIVVSNVNDTGSGSLRNAIQQANARIGADTILFCIPGAGPHTITPATSLPTLTDDGTVVDATSQPGYTLGNIILDGTVVAGAGFNIDNADTCEIWGMQIQAFLNGIFVNNADRTVIGGLTRGNVVSSNTGAGIFLNNATNSTLQANRIGTDAAAAANLGNATDGVYIAGGSGNILGGTNVNLYNFIAYNATGVRVATTSNTNTIQRNSIFCNATAGITLEGTANGGIGTPSITSPDVAAIGGNATANATIDLYSHSTTGCPAAPCQGRTFLGTATANGAGNWSIAGTFTIGTEVTVTATDVAGNTSDFSTCATVDVVLDLTAPILLAQIQEGQGIALGWEQPDQLPAQWVVERATASQTFQPLAAVEDVSTYLDAQPQLGENLYRIRQQLPDGTWLISDQVEVYWTQAAGFSLYPNPVSERLRLSYLPDQEAGQKMHIRITDLLGKTLYQTQLEPEPADWEYDVSGWPAGMYQIEVRQAGARLYSQKFLKQ
ncbi:MAG: T9SS type A sorting domain-containing protein [Bacteroidota bacterium]